MTLSTHGSKESELSTLSQEIQPPKKKKAQPKKKQANGPAKKARTTGSKKKAEEDLPDGWSYHETTPVSMRRQECLGCKKPMADLDAALVYCPASRQKREICHNTMTCIKQMSGSPYLRYLFTAFANPEAVAIHAQVTTPAEDRPS